MTMLIPTILVIVAFWFILIRPQRKKEKQDAEMRKNVQIGDQIVSAGGIVGIIVKLEENTVVIETGNDRSKLRLRRWAISENLSIKEEAAAKAVSKKEGKSKEEEVGIEK
ncbi:MAG: preprotein translocase subunit YajC [Oscillospiraceae bacterium]|nr:preprotein translocase subunit YajC [Oscillospiraceae bacterium]